MILNIVLRKEIAWCEVCLRDLNIFSEIKQLTLNIKHIILY